MQSQLLKDTPAIYAYFYNFIAGASPKVKGYVPDGIAIVEPARRHDRLRPARGRAPGGRGAAARASLTGGAQFAPTSHSDSRSASSRSCC